MCEILVHSDLSCRKCQDTLQLHTCVKYCTKRSKESNVKGVEDTLYRFQCIKCYVCRRRWRWCLRLLCNTVCRVQISCRRCQRYSVLCIQWPLAPPGGKARCSHTVRPVGLAVHHHAVGGGSFVFKCSGTCQTTRVIAGKTHSQSPILKCYGGAQQPGNSYKAMTKLHPPHSNRTCHKQFRI